MTKRPDFGSDLATLNANISAEVGDVLQALQQKRTAKSPASIIDVEHRSKGPAEPVADADRLAERSTATRVVQRRPRSSSRGRLAPMVELDGPLENVTTRLRQKTNELLTEAALRQRLKKESPATRQDIIEAALSDWFRKQGYRRGRDEEAGD